MKNKEIVVVVRDSSNYKYYLCDIAQMVISIDIVKWKSALFSTFIISSVPNLLLYLIPNSWLKKNDKRGVNVQHILLSFAAGGLLGDVILHIIPHLLVPHEHQANTEARTQGYEQYDIDYENAINELHNLAVNGNIPVKNEYDKHEHGHNHDAHNRTLWVGLFILFGFLLFFIGEKLLSAHLADSSTHKNETAASSSWLPESLSTMGWLNISADLMHNFTDGVAMGASCAASSIGGTGAGSSALMAAATLSIFCHEVPHEIGDFAVLVESGMRYLF